jgi:hypothetical protein
MATANQTANTGKSSNRKDIYALFGGSKCGKTTTIKEIYRILTIKYPNCILPRKKKYGYDMRIEMKIKVGIEYILVGINTSGDSKKIILSGLNYFVSKGCNIIFCAENRKNCSQGANLPTQNTTIGQWAKTHSYNLIPTIQNTTPKKNKTLAETNYETAKDIVKNKAKL